MPHAYEAAYAVVALNAAGVPPDPELRNPLCTAAGAAAVAALPPAGIPVSPAVLRAIPPWLDCAAQSRRSDVPPSRFADRLATLRRLLSRDCATPVGWDAAAQRLQAMVDSKASCANQWCAAYLLDPADGEFRPVRCDCRHPGQPPVSGGHGSRACWLGEDACDYAVAGCRRLPDDRDLALLCNRWDPVGGEFVPELARRPARAQPGFPYEKLLAAVAAALGKPAVDHAAAAVAHDLHHDHGLLAGPELCACIRRWGTREWIRDDDGGFRRPSMPEIKEAIAWRCIIALPADPPETIERVIAQLARDPVRYRARTPCARCNPAAADCAGGHETLSAAVACWHSRRLPHAPPRCCRIAVSMDTPIDQPGPQELDAAAVAALLQLETRYRE